MTLRAELVGEARCELGESPLWLPDRGEVAWLDIVGCCLHRFHVRTGASASVTLSEMVTAIGLTGGPELVAATRTGLGRVDLETGEVTPLSQALVAHPDDRMNDGAVAPDGTFWAGSCVAAERSGGGSLWRWRGGEEAELVLDGVTISNGLDWLARDPLSTVYVDSAAGGIDVLALDETGTVVDRRRLASIDPADGEPDGLTLDEHDVAWVAVWGGSEVRAYDMDGTLQEVIALPVRNPSSCIFGGEDGSTLFITSAREDLSDPGPLDGRLLACRLPVRGQRPRRFGARHRSRSAQADGGCAGQGGPGAW